MGTAIRTCPLCEATCGLEITTQDDEVVRVHGDADDVFSHGFLCPKGVSLKQLHEDPDRLRAPLLKQPDGSFVTATWDEAFVVIAEHLPAVTEARGRDAVAVYLGNPAAHTMAPVLYGRVLLKALGTKNIFSASTVDQYPKQMASALMFGSGSSVPVPDLDRTDHLLILGANPLASNGSLMTAPDVRGRLASIQARGGKIVVVDPRRTRTAQMADEHVFIRPGTDALLLFAIVHVLFDEGLTADGAAADVGALAHCDGIDTVRALALDFPPEATAAATGVPADVVRGMARELAAAPTAAVYGRIGTTTQAFGTTASWLVDVVNALTGNLDRPGGAMFTAPAAGSPTTRGAPGRGRGARFGRWGSRVRGLGEVFGELPVAVLAEEIETPGQGQVRALITIAGNPVLSTPNSERLAAALSDLDFMVSVDIYVNETTRHADVILPPPSSLERSHYDLALYGFAVRNVANYSPPVFPPPDGMPDEWQTLLRLVGVATGQGPDADVGAIDDFVALEAVRREVADEHSPLAGLVAEEVLASLAPRVGPERLLDLMLRSGPYELTLADLEAAPHGVDLGALEPRLPGALRTGSGRVEFAPPEIVADVERLQAVLETQVNGQIVLVGRRDLRSNNSWMHNLPILVKGPERCTLHVHPRDAARAGLQDGAAARVTSRAGSVEIVAEITEDVMPGVVSIPHGWGHDVAGARMDVARGNAGVNSNVLTDENAVEPLSGTAILNGIPVELSAAL